MRRTACALALCALVTAASAAGTAGALAGTTPGAGTAPGARTALGAQTALGAGTTLKARELALAREVLGPSDGWGAAEGGTSGGSAATAANVRVVSDRESLVAALAGDTPKIVFVKGRVEAGTGTDNRRLTCEDHAAGTGYDLPAYLAAYDPAVWGTDREPSGPLEDARVAAAARQAERVRIPVGSNTTLIGLGDTARIVGGNLVLEDVENVIVRNLRFSDAADCFPAWDPTDGPDGNWNSAYDNVSLLGARHVWLDHNTFTDQPNLDRDQPTYFGRPYQVHDGASDITRGSDLVTVSWNSYQDHDKTMLIGSTNNPAQDLGKLRVTVHHNEFDSILQRAPRVRFGRVDVLNNYYRINGDDEYVYSWGVGVQSAIVAENNYFRIVGTATEPSAVIYDWGGTAIRAVGNLVSADGARATEVDLLAAHNLATGGDLTADVGWTPTLRPRVDPAHLVRKLVPAGAGAGRLSW